MRIFMAMALFAAHAAAWSQADIGLVNLVEGEVAYAPASGQPGRAKAFMKVREGDRFDVPPGAQVRVVYFQGARQERWRGPSSFRAALLQGSAISGAPAEVAVLPASVPQRIARVPDLMENARLGGIQVRSAQSPRRVQEDTVREAHATYKQLRSDLPADDLTAELFLYSALNEFQLYEEMAPVVTEMLRKQPQSEEVKSLDAWLKTRRAR